MKKSRFIPLLGAMILSSANIGFSADQNAAALAAFHNYLITTGLNSRWQDGEPMRLDSAEIRTAYGNRQFYFTFKAPPLPPGAAWQELIDRHKREMAEYKKHSLRITLGIDQQQKAAPFQKAEDFNLGLMPVKSDEDARIAAAAILSLIGTDEVHPAVISARDVTVTGTSFGWTCNVRQPKGVDGTVVFDPAGKCIKATKSLNYTPPVPP